MRWTPPGDWLDVVRTGRGVGDVNLGVVLDVLDVELLWAVGRSVFDDIAAVCGTIVVRSRGVELTNRVELRAEEGLCIVVDFNKVVNELILDLVEADDTEDEDVLVIGVDFDTSCDLVSWLGTIAFEVLENVVNEDIMIEDLEAGDFVLVPGTIPLAIFLEEFCVLKLLFCPNTTSATKFV